MHRDHDTSPDDMSSEDFLVGRIVRAAGHERLADTEKQELWDRIAGDMRGRGKRIGMGWWRLAAAVAVLLFTGWWLWVPQRVVPPDILVFAKAQYLSDTVHETRLLRGVADTVTFNGPNTAVSYSGQGTQVTVNQQDRYRQDPSGKGAYHTLLVPYGRRASVSLEDGTTVWLNAGSRMVYPVVFDAGKREVYLEGEAYFEVAQHAGQPFYVYTNRLQTAVLGTSFNINSYADEAVENVVLVEGSVGVSVSGTQKQLILVPGEQAAFAGVGKGLSRQAVNTAAYTSWKDGKLYFNQAPLPQIFKQLSRYFNISIISPTDEISTFSGDLDLTEDIGDMLRVISISTGLKYERTDKGFVFKR